jgi:hypothetical protein
MSYFEDIARIRVNEAIQEGLKSQEVRRGLGRRKLVSWNVALAVIGVAALVVVIILLV